MAAHVTFPKTPPMQVAERTLLGLERGIEQIMADDRAIAMDSLVRNDPAKLYADFQRRWDKR